MPKRRKWFSLLAAGAVAFLLPGCGRQAKSGPTEIVYWTGWSGFELELQHKMVDEFNRTHPNIHVRILSVFNATGDNQKVHIAMAGGDTPDVCSAVWTNELAGYAMRGALSPLDDFLKASGRRPDEFVPGAWDMLQYHGHTWGLVGTLTANFIVYNKDSFEQKGLRPPTNLAEWEAVNTALTERTPGGSYKAYGMRPSSLMDWAYVFGGHWYEPKTGKVTATDPGNVRALKFLQDFAKKNDIRRMEVFESTFGSNQTPSGPFFTGKQSMQATGPWIEQFIERYAPKNFRYGWFPYPAPPDGRPLCTTLNSSCFVIPAASKHKKEAWTFLNWFLSPKQNEQFCLGIDNGSPLKAVAASPALQKDPLLKYSALIAGGKNAFGPPQMPIWPTYLAEIQRAEDKATHSGGDPYTLLLAVQKKVEKALRDAQREAVY
ncbi:MAG TPA: ABC transporter substrate-binding protein [Armatimonadota bacterium]|jgi:multiple sugar transport system substrate-binding protein